MPTNRNSIWMKKRQSQRLLPYVTLASLLIALVIVILQVNQHQSGNTHAQTANCTVSSADLTVDTEEQKLLQLVNTYRQQHNLAALKPSANLNQAAAWLSRDMATKSYLSHTDSLGRAPEIRFTNCGYSTLNVNSGENIAGPTTDANATFTQWKNSAVHNANMLNGTYVVAGIAHSVNTSSSWYWVLDFGAQEDNVSLSQSQPSILPSTAPSTITQEPSPTQLYVTPTTYCLGPCITPLPETPMPTPTQPVVQSTDTPMPSSFVSPSNPVTSVSPTSSQSQPSPKSSEGLLALLLSIIAIIIDFLKKLF